MTDFELGSEIELVCETAEAFARNRLRPREREHERARAVAPDVVDAYHEIGLPGLELPESLGGAGLGALARVLVLEALGWGDAGAAVGLDPLGPALYPLRELGGESALERFARPLLDRRGARAVLAFDPAGAHAGLGGGRVSTDVPWVPADRVDLLVLLGTEGASVVEEGIETERVRGAGLRAAGASRLRLRDVPVAAAWEDAAGARRARARARLWLASLLVGVMRASAEYSRGYARERVAFGRPIAHHQALAFLIADMASAVEGSRLLVREAAWRLDAGLDAEEACATAFVECAEAADFVTPNGVQILGGHGFMQDYPVEKFMREGRVLSIALGGTDPAREEAGRQLASVEGETILPLGSLA